MADLLGCRSYLSTDCQKHYRSVLTQKSANTVENLLWFKKWCETNDDSYREKIILGNMKLVLHITSKRITQDYAVDADDLLQIGIEGLIKAVDSFDYQKGYSFTSYASRVISNELNMKFRKMKYLKMIISLDQLIDSTDEDNTLTFDEVIKDPNSDFEADIMHMTMLSLLESALDCLTERYKNIIIDYFGLYGHKALNQKDCAEKYGISQSYMCRIKQTALKKMKVYLLSKL